MQVCSLVDVPLQTVIVTADFDLVRTVGGFIAEIIAIIGRDDSFGIVDALIIGITVISIGGFEGDALMSKIIRCSDISSVTVSRDVSIGHGRRRIVRESEVI